MMFKQGYFLKRAALLAVVLFVMGLPWLFFGFAGLSLGWLWKNFGCWQKGLKSFGNFFISIVLILGWAFILYGMASEFSRYSHKKESCKKLYAITAAKLPPVVALARKEPLFQGREVDEDLNYSKDLYLGKPLQDAWLELLPASQLKDKSISVFLPLNESQYFYFHGHSHFKYADVRRLKTGQTQVIHYDLIKLLLDARTDYQGDFWDYLKDDLALGGVAARDGIVESICIIQEDDDSEWGWFRKSWSALMGVAGGTVFDRVYVLGWVILAILPMMGIGQFFRQFQEYKSQWKSIRLLGLGITGPWLILPIAIAAGLWGSSLSNNGIGEARGIQLFLDGNTDLAGTSIFAATMVEYVLFGFLASFYLCLRLDQEVVPQSFFLHILKSLWILKFHILAFVLGGTGNFGSDAYIFPNDFRNMFVWAGLLYFLSMIWIVMMRRLSFRVSRQLFLAPLFIYMWLILGSDGNTAIAGQSRNSGDNPQPIVRGVRHGIMLQWHNFCDNLFGDIKNDF